MKTKNYFWKVNIYTFFFVLVNEIISQTIFFTKVPKTKFKEIIDKNVKEENRWAFHYVYDPYMLCLLNTAFYPITFVRYLQDPRFNLCFFLKNIPTDVLEKRIENEFKNLGF